MVGVPGGPCSVSTAKPCLFDPMCWPCPLILLLGHLCDHVFCCVLLPFPVCRRRNVVATMLFLIPYLTLARDLCTNRGEQPNVQKIQCIKNPKYKKLWCIFFTSSKFRICSGNARFSDISTFSDILASQTDPLFDHFFSKVDLP